MLDKKCVHCGTMEEELRPYGPRGAWVCFDCGFSSPERKAETEKNFLSQLNAIDGPVIIGDEVGPYPATNHPDIKLLLG